MVPLGFLEQKSPGRNRVKIWPSRHLPICPTGSRLPFSPYVACHIKFFSSPLSPGFVPCNGSLWGHTTDSYLHSGANEICVSRGGHLAIVRTDADRMCLVTTAPSPVPIWVGFDDMLVEGEYVWVDGERFNSSTRFVWDSAEPGTGPDLESKDCGQALGVSGLLRDADCDSPNRAPVACQIDQGEKLVKIKDTWSSWV